MQRSFGDVHMNTMNLSEEGGTGRGFPYIGIHLLG